LLYRLIKLILSANTIKLISSFLSNRKFKVSVEGELSTPRQIQAGVPQGSVLSPMLYNVYINYALQTPDTQLALFADDTCIYATDRKEGFTIRKLQRVLTMEAWFER
jgi:retron-type reverse transcriptase